MIPLKYNVQNLKARGVSTLLSILGIGIVIAVMLSMMALYNGVKKATTTAASKDAMMVLREGAQAEVSSWVTKEAYRIIRALPGVQKDSKAQPLISPEIVIAFKIPKKDNPKGSNVIVRGVTQNAFGHEFAGVVVVVGNAGCSQCFTKDGGQFWLRNQKNLWPLLDDRIKSFFEPLLI